jgi:hypothetical protein
VGHVISNTLNGNAYRVFVQNPGVKSDRLEEPWLDGRTKIKCKVNFTL